MEKVDFMAATHWLMTKYHDRTWNVRGGAIVVGLILIAGTWWNPAGWGAVVTIVAGGVEALATGAVVYDPSLVTVAPARKEKIQNGEGDLYYASQVSAATHNGQYVTNTVPWKGTCRNMELHS